MNNNGKCIGISYGHNGNINCIKNIIENIYISGSNDGEIKLWNLNKCIDSIIGDHEDEIK